MHYIQRRLAVELKKAARHFPVLIVTGPRRAGKTTLLRKCFPRASYHLMEDPDVVSRVRSDPRSFLEEVKTPAILDEIQNVPEIFNYVRTKVDLGGHRTAKWFLTGSQEASLMRGVTESMAGRAAVFQLLPLSHEESARVSPFRGGFPEPLARPAAAETWFQSYIQTYLERDVRAISSIRDLATFRRFLSLVAGRAGQMLNRTELAAPMGVSVPTITEWLNILEITQQILLVPPFFENFGKRLVKSRKLYFTDTGLLCHLLRIESENALRRSAFLGSVFESFVASEIVKWRLNAGKGRDLYCFRDRQGLEIDFMVPTGDRKLILVEAKATRTPSPSMALSMKRLQKGISFRYQTNLWVVHLPSSMAPGFSTLGPGVRAVSSDKLPSIFV